MPADPNRQAESLAAAVSEVSEKMSVLVREEIELAKAEMTAKVSSIARGAAAVAVGAVFGFFVLIFALLTIAWALESVFNNIWLGFLVTTAILVVLTVFAFLFAWRKLRVGAPKPTMAIDEAKKIRATVQSGSDR